MLRHSLTCRSDGEGATEARVGGHNGINWLAMDHYLSDHRRDTHLVEPLVGISIALEQFIVFHFSTAGFEHSP